MFIGARLCLLRPLFSDPSCVEFCCRSRSASPQGPFGKARIQASSHVDTHADARACRPAHLHTCALVHARAGQRGHILHTGPHRAHCAKHLLQMEHAHAAPHMRAYLVPSLLMNCPGQSQVTQRSKGCHKRYGHNTMKKSRCAIVRGMGVLDYTWTATLTYKAVAPMMHCRYSCLADTHT